MVHGDGRSGPGLLLENRHLAEDVAVGEDVRVFSRFLMNLTILTLPDWMK